MASDLGDIENAVILFGGLYLFSNLAKISLSPPQLAGQNILPVNTPATNLLWGLNPFTIPVQEGLNIINSWVQK